MASSRQLAAGRHVTSIVLHLATINADGSLAVGVTEGTNQYTLTNKTSFIGFLEDVEFSTETNVEDGTVLGSPSDNDIPTTSRSMCTLTEPLRYANGNILAKSFYNTASNADGTSGTPYANVTISRGGKTFSFTGVMRSYRETYRKNKLVGVMTMSMADINTANPTYS